MADYMLHRKYVAGRGSWNMRASEQKLRQTAAQHGNLIVECDHADRTVRFIIPVGPDTAFARDVLPHLTFNDERSCSFDVSPSYTFTWRHKIKFDGRPYLASEDGHARDPIPEDHTHDAER